MHMVVLGETGFGKSTLIESLLTQIWSLHPTLPWLVFDLKGEYLQRLQHINGIVVLKPGLKKTEVYTNRKIKGDFGAGYSVTFMPLRVDLLDVKGRDRRDETENGVITRIFTLLKESLASTFKESSELSPLMEKTLLKSLHGAYSAYQGGGGFLDLLISEIEDYAEQEGRSRGRSDIVRSSEALINRIERFRRGYLEDVLNSGEGTLTPTLISHSRVIIDLSECIPQGTTEDLRLLLNIIIEKVLEEAIRKGLTQAHDIRHITVVEEANLLVPEVLHRKTTGDITPTEEMFLISRGYGEGFILAAQRPTISSFTLSNAGTKVIFRIPSDTKRIRELLGINEVGENTIKNLQKFEAFVATIEGGVCKVVTPKPRPLRPLELVPTAMTQLQETPKTRPTPPSHQSQQSSKSQPLASTPLPAAKIGHNTDRDTEKHSSSPSGDCSSDKSGQRGDDTGNLNVKEEDLSRLLKRGLSSDKFKLFMTIAASPQSNISTSDAVRKVFQGKKWKYLDAVRSLANRTYWKIPPLVLENHGTTLQLTAYGAAIWRLIEPLLMAVKRRQ